MEWIEAIFGIYIIGMTGFLTVEGPKNIILFRVPLLIGGTLILIDGLSRLNYI